MTTPANYAFVLTRHICAWCGKLFSGAVLRPGVLPCCGSDRCKAARAKSWRERGRG